MIDVKEASRLDTWVQEAVAEGGKLLCGGKRDGAMLEATLMEGVDRNAKLYREEAFGPVAALSKLFPRPCRGHSCSIHASAAIGPWS